MEALDNLNLEVGLLSIGIAAPAKNLLRKLLINNGATSEVLIDSVPNAPQAAILTFGIGLVLKGVFPNMNTTTRMVSSAVITSILFASAELYGAAKYGSFNTPDMIFEAGGAIAMATAAVLVNNLANKD